jgi:Leucine-rich repeat (LRR) protein
MRFRYKVENNSNWIQINNIDNLPDDTIIIDCTRQYLTSLPNWDNLTKLEIIYCSNNDLTYLPNWDNCINLKKIICFCNNLEYLPEWNTLTKLEFINCTNNNLTYLPEWNNLIKLETIYCSTNKLLSLPNWNNLINLKIIECVNNNLSTLPEWNNLIKLENIYCYKNKLTSLPNWDSLSNLRVINCNSNKLSYLPEWNNLTKIVHINCNYNKLTTLPNWETLHQLHTINCTFNNLIILPNWDSLINLEFIDCRNNNLTSLPASFGNLNYLVRLYYNDNPIEYIPVNLLRRIDNIYNGNIYNDNQNVHNSSIQQSLKKNIIKLLETKPEINIDECINEIKYEISTCNLIIEYTLDNSIHTELNVTFSDVLLAVWSRIREHINKQEIIKILNIEMLDSECKCFTGRLTRLVNCLCGFEQDIVYEIDSSEQMSNISKQLYSKYDNIEDYYKELRKEFLERGYTEEDIKKWSDI